MVKIASNSPKCINKNMVNLAVLQRGVTYEKSLYLIEITFKQHPHNNGIFLGFVCVGVGVGRGVCGGVCVLSGVHGGGVCGSVSFFQTSFSTPTRWHLELMPPCPPLATL